MNGRGLGLGLTAVPELELNAHPERPRSSARDGGLYYAILEECANVGEAVALARSYDIRSLWYQIVVADAAGDAVIIGPGIDGELAFTWKEEGRSSLVASSLNAAHPRSSCGIDARRRFAVADGLLDPMDSSEDCTLESFRNVLEAVHREGSVRFGSYTVYSSIFDLSARRASLYFLSRFGEAVQIDLAAEMAHGEQSYRIGDLVSESTREAALARYEAVQQRPALSAAVSALALMLLLSVLPALACRRARSSQMAPTAPASEVMAEGIALFPLRTY